jgi:MarR family transcriptional regulator, temperature-dependent positive regulator of motility
MLTIPSVVVALTQKEMDRESGPGLIELLTQLHKSFYKRTSEELLGMRVRQYLALCKVRDHPGISQQDLAEMMLLDPNAVVLLLNELEDLGFSLRRRDPEDRRRHIVELTETGSQALARAEKGRESIEDELLGGITPEEKVTLRKILTRALDGLARVPVELP